MESETADKSGGRGGRILCVLQMLQHILEGQRKPKSSFNLKAKQCSASEHLSVCGPQTSSITTKLVRNAILRSHLRLTE